MNQKVIDRLNMARSRELLAISQYMIQHYELEDKGYGTLAHKIKEIAFVEMRHAEALAERILFLGGEPSTKPETGAQKGQSIPDMLKTDIGLEDDAIKQYNESAKICDEESDRVSKEVFEKLLENEDDHIDEFQKILEHVEELGDVYLSTLLD